jgi:hypothetical protein
MNDAIEASRQGSLGSRRWLLFIHQLPPKPDYLRVKTRRRLRRIGAVAVKQTVYALPNSDAALEDLQWLRQEIEAEGGSAVIVEGQLIEGLSDEELDAMLASERARTTGDDQIVDAATIDQVQTGSTWVTRKDVHVDRIASAWLIRRFIDPEARFKFVPARGYARKRGEIRFDMYEAEYTHAGEDCTFQTLVRRFGLRDRALVAIGEVVHDIDCKDDRYHRPETAGFAALVHGIVEGHDPDRARIERGGAVLDDLYAYFQKRRGRPRGAREELS